MKRKLFSISSIVSVLLSVYSLCGVLQAASLFRGERALHNYQFWGIAFLGFLAITAAFYLLAARERRIKSK